MPRLPVSFAMDDLDKIIMREIKNFVFEIAINSKKDHEDYDMVTQRRSAADKRFSNAYSEIKGLKGVDFDRFSVTESKSRSKPIRLISNSRA